MESKDWILTVANSSAEEPVLYRFHGTEKQVRKKLASFVREDKKNDREEFDYGCTKPEEFESENNGMRLYGYATYGDYHIDYTADVLDSIPEA